MVGASVLDGTRSVEISDLVTHDFFPKKSQLWSYCDSSCSNVGQFSYYYHITEKLLCINELCKMCGVGGRYFSSPPHLEISGGGGGGGGGEPSHARPVLMHMLDRNH